MISKTKDAYLNRIRLKMGFPVLLPTQLEYRLIIIDDLKNLVVDSQQKFRNESKTLERIIHDNTRREDSLLPKRFKSKKLESSITELTR